MSHNQKETTQIEQELNPDQCVEKLASNHMSPNVLLFISTQESENCHRLLTFGDTQSEHFTSTLLF